MGRGSASGEILPISRAAVNMSSLGNAVKIQPGPPNAGILRHLQAGAQHANFPPAARRLAAAGPMPKTYGTHPDIADHVWHVLSKKLPESCAWVVYGRPVLIRPSSGVIFAFGGGTHTYALRLPAAVRDEAIKAGATRVYHYRAYPALQIEASTLDLAEIGDEWVFSHFLKGEEDWCLAAYEFAERDS